MKSQGIWPIGASFLRRVVFVGKAPLRWRLDFKRISLRAEGRCDPHVRVPGLTRMRTSSLTRDFSCRARHRNSILPVVARTPCHDSHARLGAAALLRGNGGPAHGLKPYDTPTRSVNNYPDQQLLDFFARNRSNFSTQTIEAGT